MTGFDGFFGVGAGVGVPPLPEPVFDEPPAPEEAPLELDALELEVAPTVVLLVSGGEASGVNGSRVGPWL